MAGKFKPVVLGLKSHRIHGLLPFFRASRTGDHLTKNNAATRGGARFQVDDGCKKPTATSLYTVDPLDPNHDATMRIVGDAPKSQRPILFPGAESMGDGGLPLPRIVFWPFRRYARRGAKTWYLFFLPITPLNAA